MRCPTIAGVLTVLALGPTPALSQQAPAPSSAEQARAEVLVLGVYHMANPGRDLFTGQADDVLAPGRQVEIAALMDVLKRFRPTRIAVEASFSSSATARRYEEYVAGNHELSRNEIEQIGFRLARQLGHEAVYPVDVSSEFPYPRLVDYANAHGQTQELETLLADIGETVEAFYEYLAAHTVLETLMYMNSDEYVAADVGFYYRQAHFGKPGNWAGADLVSAWFHRNIRIYSNVMSLIASPNERVLVIMGAGHLGWLQHNFASDPTIRLRKLAEFAQPGHR